MSSILHVAFPKRGAEISTDKNNRSKLSKFKIRGSKELHSKLAIAAIGISLVMLCYWPTWTGNIEDPQTAFQVPSYYGDVSHYFADKGDSRILLTPHRFFYPYEWGLLSAEVMSSEVTNPLLFENVGKVGSDPAGDALGQYLTSSIYENDTAGVSMMLRYLGVDYVVQQNDINYTYYNSKSPLEMSKILGSISCLEKVETFGQVDIYKVKDPSGIIEASDHYQVSPLMDNQSIENLVIQKALGYDDQNSNRSITNFALYKQTVSGNLVINTSAMILGGTNLSVVLFSDHGTNYLFQASSNSTGENGIYRIDNRTSVLHTTNNNSLCQTNQLINMSVVINNGSARLLINGIDAADQVLVNYSGINYNVGFASWNSTVMFGSLNIHSFGWDYSPDLQISTLKDLNNWTFQRTGWAITAFPIQKLNYSGNVPLYISAQDTKALDYLNDLTLVKPGSITYHLVDPVTTVVSVNDSNGPFLLLMKNTWGDWRATIDGKPINADLHVRANGYSNAWIVNKTGNYTIVLKYQPQQYFTIGSYLSLAALISISAFVLVYWTIKWRGRNMKSEEENK